MRPKGATSLPIGLALCALVFSGTPVGCGGGGGGNGNGGGASTGNVEGFVFAASGRAGRAAGITLGLSATPPIGLKALGGVAVTIPNSTGSATTEASGHFVLHGATPGLRRLRITTLDGTVAEFPVTILGNATIQAGTPAITRQQAINKVKQAVSATTPLNAILLMAPQQPLPAGVSVSPALGGPDGQDDPVLDTKITTPQWLCYVDANPEAFLQHTVSYYLVDATTGQMTVKQASSYPAINGLVYYGNLGVNLTSPDMVLVPTAARAAERGGGRLALPAVQARQVSPGPTRDNVFPSCSDPKVYVLLIEGDPESDMQQNIANMTDFLNKNKLTGLTTARIDTYTLPTDGYVPAKSNIQDKFNQINKVARPCDTVLVYIAAHGIETGTQIVNRGPIEDGLNEANITAGVKLDVDLDFDHCPACHIVVVWDSCFSGQALMDLMAHITANDAAYHGKTVILMASSAKGEYSIGNRYSIPLVQTKGGIFTNSLLDALNQAAGPSGTVSLDTMDSVFNTAATATTQETSGDVTNDKVTPEVKGQHPVFWRRPLAPGETCGCMNCGTGPTTVPTGTVNDILSPVGTNTWAVTQSSQNKITLYNSTTNAAQGILPIGQPLRMAVLENQLYVTLNSANAIVVFDLSTGNATNTIPVDNPTDIAVNPNTGRLYVISNLNVLTVINTATNKVTANLSLEKNLGPKPCRYDHRSYLHGFGCLEQPLRCGWRDQPGHSYSSRKVAARRGSRQGHKRDLCGRRGGQHGFGRRRGYP